MSRDHDEVAKRPERVVILDADDPMTEVHGRFVWIEEHERVLEEVRRQAFADGYDAAHRELASQPQALNITLARRRTPRRTLRAAVIALAIICFLLAAPVLVFTH